jgi:hypothetical protein
MTSSQKKFLSEDRILTSSKTYNISDSYHNLFKVILTFRVAPGVDHYEEYIDVKVLSKK